MPIYKSLEGLEAFKKKVASLNDKIINQLEYILKRIQELGTEYAKSLYSGENIKVDTTILSGENKGTIFAEGIAVAYLEFGTGEKGRGSYEGNLPNQRIEFFSTRLQKDVTLDKWVYSYAHEIDYTQSLWGGFVAQSQMWKTAQYLRKIIPQIVKEAISK